MSRGIDHLPLDDLSCPDEGSEGAFFLAFVSLYTGRLEDFIKKISRFLIMIFAASL